MVSLLIRESDGRNHFEINGRDFGDVLEITPRSACPDRGELAVYFVDIQISDSLRTTVQFPVEPNSELDSWLWMSLDQPIWIWLDPEYAGKLDWEINYGSARMERD